MRPTPSTLPLAQCALQQRDCKTHTTHLYLECQKVPQVTAYECQTSTCKVRPVFVCRALSDDVYQPQDSISHSNQAGVYNCTYRGSASNTVLKVIDCSAHKVHGQVRHQAVSFSFMLSSPCSAAAVTGSSHSPALPELTQTCSGPGCHMYNTYSSLVRCREMQHFTIAAAPVPQSLVLLCKPQP